MLTSITDQLFPDQANPGCIILLHEPWEAVFTKVGPGGETLSEQTVQGNLEPSLFQVEGELFAPLITKLDLFAHAVASGLALAKEQPFLVWVPADLKGELATVMEDRYSPYSQLEWDKIREGISSSRAILVAEGETPKKRHFRLRQVQPQQWAAHLVTPGGERADLSGSIGPGFYPKDGKPEVIEVTGTLLQVAALDACLKAALAHTNQGVISVLVTTSLYGSIKVSLHDLRKGLRGALSTTTAMAFPWLAEALSFVLDGEKQGRFSLRWVKTADRMAGPGVSSLGPRALDTNGEP